MSPPYASGETYYSAIAALGDVSLKTANEVFARYRLAITRQKPGQSMDEYLHELRRLSKDRVIASGGAVVPGPPI